MPTGRLIGYARVSTADQSLDLQTDALKRAGVPETNIYTDKASGVAARRPGLASALKHARAGDTIIVWRLDRFGRSLLDLLRRVEDLDRRSIGFRSLTESIDTQTPIGRMLLAVLGAVAQFERDLTRERTKAGIAAGKARGKVYGPKPKLSAKDEREVSRLLKGGGDAGEIAKRYKVSRQTIYRVRWRAEGKSR